MEVKVVEYRSEWAEAYQEEAKEICQILKDELIEIHHIGSTSVIGLQAKPIIDILPVVSDIARIDQLNQEFELLGYECMGEFGIIGRRYYRKGGNVRTHHIHLFEKANSYEINRHLAVRNYLRTHEAVAKEYGKLKSRLALLYPQDIDGYCDGKDTFVKEMERAALEWQCSR